MIKFKIRLIYFLLLAVSFSSSSAETVTDFSHESYLSDADKINGHVIPGHNHTNTLRVMTLNLGHGRGDNFHQLFTSEDEIRRNLDAIIKVSRRESPHIFAVQEADSSAYWSGRFNHVDYLATHSGLSNTVQGEHVDGYVLNYGTSILSNLDLFNHKSHTFKAASPLTFSKGFVVSTIKWPDAPEDEIDIISVHLDFMLDSTRQRQGDELINFVKERNRPLIIMGDLNNEWNEEDSVLVNLISNLNLKAYQPESDKFISYPALNKRFDWILVSKDLEFISFKVLSDELSDHRAVIADLRLAK